MILNPNIWAPQYWFVLQTISLTYPLNPNSICKRKYYDFVQNIPLFIPDIDLSNEFSNLLDEFPVTPYLDTRASFQKWVIFMHNKINKLNKKPELTIVESWKEYYQHYKPMQKKNLDQFKRNEKIIYLVLISTLIFTCYSLRK